MGQAKDKIARVIRKQSKVKVFRETQGYSEQAGNRKIVKVIWEQMGSEVLWRHKYFQSNSRNRQIVRINQKFGKVRPVIVTGSEIRQKTTESPVDRGFQVDRLFCTLVKLSGVT